MLCKVKTWFWMQIQIALAGGPIARRGLHGMLLTWGSALLSMAGASIVYVVYDLPDPVYIVLYFVALASPLSLMSKRGAGAGLPAPAPRLLISDSGMASATKYRTM